MKSEKKTVVTAEHNFFVSMQSSENVPAYQTQHSYEGSPAMQNDKNSKADVKKRRFMQACAKLQVP